MVAQLVNRRYIPLVFLVKICEDSVISDSH